MTGRDLYRISDFVPDFDAIASEFATRSRALSAHAKMCTDIAYGPRPREILDLIFPDRPVSGAPLHVFVHGGYWRSGEKANYRFVAAPVLALGGVAALVEYDLMPGQRLPVLVNQVRRAVLWLQQHAAEFGADPKRVTVSGHSAGAHLASFLAATGRQEARPPVLPDLKGILLLSGIYDLSDIPDSFLRHEAQMNHQEASAWSPLSSTQHPGPRRIIAYGANETAPFQTQARAFYQRLETGTRGAELIAARDLNHMNVVLSLADADTILGKKLGELVA